MKYLHTLITVCILFVTLSCSSNDDNDTNNQNTLVIGGEVYPIASVFIETRYDNTILYFQNKSESEVINAIENGATLNNFNYCYVSMNQSPLTSGTYNDTDTDAYEVILDATINEGELNGGILVLEDGSATDSANSVDATIDAITDTFLEASITFIRQDGVEIKVSYSGTYFTFPESNLD